MDGAVGLFKSFSGYFVDTGMDVVRLATDLLTSNSSVLSNFVKALLNITAG